MGSEMYSIMYKEARTGRGGPERVIEGFIAIAVKNFREAPQKSEGREGV